MNNTATPCKPAILDQAKRVGVVLLTFCMIALIGCGSTKVYTADKTIVYRDSIYNLSNVQQIGSREEAKLSNGDVVNLRGKDKKEIEALIKENKPVLVTMVVELDDRDMVYLRANVDRYSEYSRMQSRFESALKDITKFMGNKKSTQLKLK